MKMRLMEGGMTLLLIAVVALPFFGFAKGGDKIYVDKDASGTQNGSSKHPYKTISQATKKADKGDEVVVSSGTYKERVTLPRGVKLSGSGKTKTIIKSDDKKRARLNCIRYFLQQLDYPNKDLNMHTKVDSLLVNVPNHLFKNGFETKDD